MSFSRRRSVGAEVMNGGVLFRVWAPEHKTLTVVPENGGREHPLTRERDGYFSGLLPEAKAGFRYRLRIDGGAEAFPDPASRFQPDGPHGPTEVIDASSFAWPNRDWNGPGRHGNVIYELHVGTFTRQGTYAAAIEHLDALRETGITVIELMPVNEFAGTFGWGYDGVDLWAPTHLYGRPDDLRRFVDAAHARGLAVILDVVFNHLGPDGCYLQNFSRHYFTKKYRNEWGEAVNFDDEHAEGSREFFSECAAMWIDEYRFDGLRIDATQSLNDVSRTHIVELITEKARAAAPDRSLLIIAENEPQDVTLLDEYGVDALWNDDWHHAARIALTGKREAYYTDYLGNPQEFVSMAKLGFLFQGQHYKWQKKRRGTPSAHVPPERFVVYLQNHDQIANSATGERIHQIASPGDVRAMTALLLLGPQTPMLFQGQEFGASAPFLYFADHTPELAAQVAEGRRQFLTQFPSIKGATPLPHDRNTFERCKLDHSERERNRTTVDLHRDLIRLRRTQSRENLHGAVLSERAFVLRWLTGDDADRLLIVNLGSELHLDPAPEPLLAPPRGREWEILFSTEDPEYGGGGISTAVDWDENWCMPGHAALLLQPRLS
jgi:maltooligosyltrehalose trehalohydrolase